MNKKGLLAATLIVFVAGLSTGLQRAQAGSSQFRTMEFGGRTRRYILHVPPKYDPAQSVSLVLVLHGATQSPEAVESSSRMSELANQNGFIAVYPSGTGRNQDVLPTWNSGNCCSYAMLNQVDDVGFLRALIDDIEHQYSVDPKRVYATGISNGGMMAYRVACELSDKIAAIAPVEGAQNVGCEPTNPVAVIVFHGTDDRLVPFEGGTSPLQLGPKRTDNSVAAAISFWVKRDGCSPTPKHSQTAEAHTDIYSGCQLGTGVALYAIQHGHHMWPGSANSGNRVAASEIIWRFFAAHPKT